MAETNVNFIYGGKPAESAFGKPYCLTEAEWASMLAAAGAVQDLKAEVKRLQAKAGFESRWEVRALAAEAWKRREENMLEVLKLAGDSDSDVAGLVFAIEQERFAANKARNFIRVVDGRRVN